MTTREREIYNALKKQYPNQTPKPSYLRKAVKIVNTKADYNFLFNGKSEGANLDLERQDMFVVIKLGYFLLREIEIEEGTGVLQTHANATAFPAAAGFTPADLQVFYNGQLKTTVDGNIQYEKFPTQLFEYVPQTIQTMWCPNWVNPMTVGILQTTRGLGPRPAPAAHG